MYCNSPGGACVQPDWCVNKGACAYSAVSWVHSSYSNANGTCVEMRPVDGVQVRDSKAANGPILNFNQSAWTALLNFVR
jgi:hypothetical protein